MIQSLVEQLNEQGLHDNFLSVGSYLAESAWKDYCYDSELPIKDDVTRYGLAVLLENTNNFMQRLDETTRAVAVGDFQKYAMPLVRAIFPELVANSIVSVQPMLGPVSLVFYMDFVYGSNKGSIKRGDTAFSSIARGPNNPSYTSPQIDNEVKGTGDGVTSTAQVPLDYSPVIPSTVTVTDGTQVIRDDGAGGFTGDVGFGASINYANGTLTWSFAAPPPAGATISVTYSYDMEGQEVLPEMDLVLQSSPIIARPRKLKTKWSLEAAFNLRSLHGIEAEVELTSAVGSEIRFEIDREIILDLQRLAGAGSVFWNRDLPVGVSFTEQKLSIIDAFVVGSNVIHKATGRGTANWILCGEGVANVIETLPGFVPNPGLPNGLVKGVYRAGRLNGRWDIFKDPFYADSYFLMGYKGMSFLEAGYVYAPYIPLYTTPTIVLDDFIGRKGLATQYGKKAINPLFYVTGEIGTKAALEAKSGLTIGSLTHGSAKDDLNAPTGKGVFGV